MSAVNAAAWVCLLAPLVAVAVITAAGTRLSRRGAGFISTGSSFVAFAGALVAFAVMLGEAPAARSHTSTAWTWLQAGHYRFGLTLLTDQLSVMMMLIVAGIGSLIIAYSVGYMEGEEEERRYFAEMSLFMFSMLLLVQAGNFLILLAGWGMVGLSSYLLIGFNHERPSAIAAAKKAFIMNAVGDATMALALFLLIEHTGQLDFAGVFARVPHGGTFANLVALGLLGGAVAKSAQIPLHTWLPDAMEGPTPVSALIHAATMVTAGVYLIVRCNPLFQDAYVIADLAAALGAATLLMAGLIALVQTDIKKVIAYSTMSQIGYMFVGAGIGAYPSAMLHLMTHAFYKALLFLTAGLIIHALSGEQDIRRMGGLGRAMPMARVAFLIGALALVGVPPFSGFFSKDSIIAATLTRGAFGYCLCAACLVGAFLTGVYIFRLYFIVFGGERSEFAQEHLHPRQGRLEGPVSMVWTVCVLAAGATFAGFLQFGSVWHPLTTWLEPVAAPIVNPSSLQESLASLASVALGVAGIWVAYELYRRHTWALPRTPALLANRFYWDELYDAVFAVPAIAVARGLNRFVERPLIAGSIAELTRGFRSGAGELGRLQNGLVRSYALAVAGGVALLAVVFLSTR